MKPLIDQLAQYAAYHRDYRNILTHIAGIPLIVIATATLLSRPVFGIASLTFSPAILAGMITAIFYLRLDFRFGIVMSLFLALFIWAGQILAAQSTSLWLASGLGVFFIGWLIQFVGHYYEGRKPAFMDDVVGLLIGPLFILAELSFMLGLRRDVQLAVEERAGSISKGSRKAHGLKEGSQ